MPSSNRLYYAIQLLQIQGVNGPGIDSGNPDGLGTYYTVPGVQSVGISTNFNLENVFQLGDFETYDVLDDDPEIELTVNKVLDYGDSVFTLAMGGASKTTTGHNLLQLASRRCNARLFVANDINFNEATGNLPYQVEMTGMYLSSFTYTFATDGNFTEEVTLVGSNKVWKAGEAISVQAIAAADGVHPGLSETLGLNNTKASGIARRAQLDLANSVLPSGLTTWDGGIIMPYDGTNTIMPHITNMTISCDLGREPLNELGSRNPYTRLVTVPLEITSEFEVLATDFDVSATNFAELKCDAGMRNGKKREIYIRVCGPTAADTTEGYNFYLGKGNRLTSVNYSGGDAGGGNVTVTYSYTGYNACYIDRGSKLTVTNAPYNGIGYNLCGRTLANVGTDVASFGTGGTGTQAADPGTT